MKIGGWDTEKEPLLIAEVGNNHEGKLDVAKKMVREAAAAGVPAIKFQTFKTQRFINRSDPARFARLSSFELSYNDFQELHDLARSLGLIFLSTPLDMESARFLNTIVDAFKIASSDNTFYPLLEYVAGTGKPILLSSGLTDLDQITSIKEFIEREWKKHGTKGELAILHCVSSYPVPDEEANLAAIPYMQERLGLPVGYSDHTLGIDACCAAAALGAPIIEKHFTLDKNYSDFRDHKLSADPADMKELLSRIKRISTLRGKARKAIQPSEKANLPLLRRSIAAACDLPQGHALEHKDLMWIRPGHGIPPGEEKQITGRRLKKAVALGDLIGTGDVE